MELQKKKYKNIKAYSRVLVKASSFVMDEAFSSFDKSGFLTSKQKWQTIWTKMGSHCIYIRKWQNIFKKLTGTLYRKSI